jgi:hypothetical protein
MRTTARREILAICVLTRLAMIGMLASPKVRADDIKAVAITSPNPLPVTGTVGVTGPISVQQSGAWNVGISTGTTIPMRNVDERGRVPYQAWTNLIHTTLAVFPIVPVGKRLVVEFVSARGLGPRFISGDVVLATSSRPLAFLSKPTVTPDGSSFTVSEAVRAYIDGGQAPQLNANSSPDIWEATLSGYLIDCSGTNGCSPIVQ